MEFPNGIAPQSSRRWVEFQRILRLQAERGPDVGAALLRYIVNAELEAIERATEARHQAEAEKLSSVPVIRRR